MKKDTMNEMFENLSNQWDVHELSNGHAARFLDKQSRKKKINYWFALSVAASVLLIVGFFTFFNDNLEEKGFEMASKQTRETDSVFTSIIKIELEKVKDKKSPENEKIISDALRQMQSMDADYEKLKTELVKKGENRQIIHAMIRNLQTRISFLEKVLEQIESNENFKNKYNEKTL